MESGSDISLQQWGKISFITQYILQSDINTHSLKVLYVISYFLLETYFYMHIVLSLILHINV